MASPREEFSNFVEMLKKSSEFARKRQIRILTNRKLEIVCFSNIERIEAEDRHLLVVYPKGSNKIKFPISKDLIVNNIDVNNLDLDYYSPGWW